MFARPAPAVVPTSDLRSWRDGVESLNPAKSPCPGLYGEAWQGARQHARLFGRLKPRTVACEVTMLVLERGQERFPVS